MPNLKKLKRVKNEIYPSEYQVKLILTGNVVGADLSVCPQGVRKGRQLGLSLPVASLPLSLGPGGHIGLPLHNLASVGVVGAIRGVRSNAIKLRGWVRGQTPRFLPTDIGFCRGEPRCSPLS